MAIKKSVKSKTPEKKIFTDSEYSVKRIYQKSPKKKPTEDAGKYPFTRGIHPGMFRERFWTMRQYSGFGDAKLTNERFKFMLENVKLVLVWHLTCQRNWI